MCTFCRNNSGMSRDDALTYGTAILVVTIAGGICLLQYYFLGFCFGMKVRVAVCSLIYRKVKTIASLISLELFNIL